MPTERLLFVPSQQQEHQYQALLHPHPQPQSQQPQQHEDNNCEHDEIMHHDDAEQVLQNTNDTSYANPQPHPHLNNNEDTSSSSSRQFQQSKLEQHKSAPPSIRLAKLCKFKACTNNRSNDGYYCREHDQYHYQYQYSNYAPSSLHCHYDDPMNTNDHYNYYNSNPHHLEGGTSHYSGNDYHHFNQHQHHHHFNPQHRPQPNYYNGANYYYNQHQQQQQQQHQHLNPPPTANVRYYATHQTAAPAAAAAAAATPTHKMSHYRESANENNKHADIVVDLTTAATNGEGEDGRNTTTDSVNDNCDRDRAKAVWPQPLLLLPTEEEEEEGEQDPMIFTEEPLLLPGELPPQQQQQRQHQYQEQSQSPQYLQPTQPALQDQSTHQNNKDAVVVVVHQQHSPQTKPTNNNSSHPQTTEPQPPQTQPQHSTLLSPSLRMKVTKPWSSEEDSIISQVISSFIGISMQSSGTCTTAIGTTSTTSTTSQQQQQQQQQEQQQQQCNITTSTTNDGNNSNVGKNSSNTSNIITGRYQSTTTEAGEVAVVAAAESIKPSLLKSPSSPPIFNSWEKLSKKLPGRTKKQIIHRWINHLHPAIIDDSIEFDEKEDILLFRGYCSCRHHITKKDNNDNGGGGGDGGGDRHHVLVQQQRDLFDIICTTFFNNTRSGIQLMKRWHSSEYRASIKKLYEGGMLTTSRSRSGKKSRERTASVNGENVVVVDNDKEEENTARNIMSGVDSIANNGIDVAIGKNDSGLISREGENHSDVIGTTTNAGGIAVRRSSSSINRDTDPNESKIYQRSDSKHTSSGTNLGEDGAGDGCHKLVDNDTKNNGNNIAICDTDWARNSGSENKETGQENTVEINPQESHGGESTTQVDAGKGKRAATNTNGIIIDAGANSAMGEEVEGICTAAKCVDKNSVSDTAANSAVTAKSNISLSIRTNGEHCQSEPATTPTATIHHGNSSTGLNDGINEIEDGRPLKNPGIDNGTTESINKKQSRRMTAAMEQLLTMRHAQRKRKLDHGTALPCGKSGDKRTESSHSPLEEGIMQGKEHEPGNAADCKDTQSTEPNDQTTEHDNDDLIVKMPAHQLQLMEMWTKINAHKMKKLQKKQQKLGVQTTTGIHSNVEEATTNRSKFDRLSEFQIDNTTSLPKLEGIRHRLIMLLERVEGKINKELVKKALTEEEFGSKGNDDMNNIDRNPNELEGNSGARDLLTRETCCPLCLSFSNKVTKNQSDESKGDTERTCTICDQSELCQHCQTKCEICLRLCCLDCLMGCEGCGSGSFCSDCAGYGVSTRGGVGAGSNVASAGNVVSGGGLCQHCVVIALRSSSKKKYGKRKCRETVRQVRSILHKRARASGKIDQSTTKKKRKTVKSRRIARTKYQTTTVGRPGNDKPFDFRNDHESLNYANTTDHTSARAKPNNAQELHMENFKTRHSPNTNPTAPARPSDIPPRPAHAHAPTAQYAFPPAHPHASIPNSLQDASSSQGKQTDSSNNQPLHPLSKNLQLLLDYAGSKQLSHAPPNFSRHKFLIERHGALGVTIAENKRDSRITEVTEVLPKSAAEAYGLHVGDIIVPPQMPLHIQTSHSITRAWFIEMCKQRPLSFYVYRKHGGDPQVERLFVSNSRIFSQKALHCLTYSAHRFVLHRTSSVLHRSCSVGMTIGERAFGEFDLTYVLDVESNSIAEKLGVMKNDIICRPTTAGRQFSNVHQWILDKIGSDQRPILFEVIRFHKIPPASRLRSPFFSNYSTTPPQDPQREVRKTQSAVVVDLTDDPPQNEIYKSASTCSTHSTSHTSQNNKRRECATYTSIGHTMKDSTANVCLEKSGTEDTNSTKTPSTVHTLRASPADAPTDSPKDAPTPLLTGTLLYSEEGGIRCHKIQGSWYFENDPESQPQKFELLRLISSDEVLRDLPTNGTYHGSFVYQYKVDCPTKKKKLKMSTIIKESNVNLTFNVQGTEPKSFVVKGSGTNQFGIFELVGTATETTKEEYSLRLHKKYITTPSAHTGIENPDNTSLQIAPPADLSRTFNNTPGCAELPPPSTHPAGVVCVRGTMFKTPNAVQGIQGIWSTDLANILLAESESSSTLDVCNKFEYQRQCGVSTRDAFNINGTLSGKYAGWFEINDEDGNTTKLYEHDITLYFRENSEGYHNVNGKGTNDFGKYVISGTLSLHGVLTIFRHFDSEQNDSVTTFEKP